MSGMIVYKSNYGSTEEYAKWLKEDTDFELLSLKNRPHKRLAEFDVVVIACPVMIGKLVLGSWIKSQWPKLKEKKVVVLAVSGERPTKEHRQNVIESSLPKTIADNLTYFGLRGRTDISKLKGMHKLLVQIGLKTMTDRQARKSMLTVVDGVDRKALKPVVDMLKK